MLDIQVLLCPVCMTETEWDYECDTYNIARIILVFRMT